MVKAGVFGVLKLIPALFSKSIGGMPAKPFQALLWLIFHFRAKGTVTAVWDDVDECGFPQFTDLYI